MPRTTTPHTFTALHYELALAEGDARVHLEDPADPTSTLCVRPLEVELGADTDPFDAALIWARLGHARRRCELCEAHRIRIGAYMASRWPDRTAPAGRGL